MAYSVLATAAFEHDLDEAVAYYLEQSGPRSAASFLGRYDSFRDLVAVLPGHGSRVGDSGLRWRKLGTFVVIYAADEERQEVQLLRLYYISSDWRHRLLGDEG